VGVKSLFIYRLIVFLVLVAIGAANYYWHLYGGWWLPKELYKERVTVVGRIASLPQQGSLGTSFLLKLETINDESVNALIKLTGYVEAGVPLRLSVGDQWQFVTRLKPLHALHNFEGLDHTYYSILQGVRASGYIVTQADNRLLLSQPNYFPLLHLRQVIQQKIEQSLKQFPEEAAIIAALTVGSTTSMTQAQWQVFRLTGTSHLVAISGLHIGLMAALGFFLFRMIGRILPRLFLKIAAPNFSAIGASLLALSYSALAGFAWPTQRSLLMVLTLSLSQCCYRTMPLWRRLSLACVVILVLEPWALLSASFMLSFCAVAALAYGLGGRWQKLKSWRQWWQMQWVIFIHRNSLGDLASGAFKLIGVFLVFVFSTAGSLCFSHIGLLTKIFVDSISFFQSVAFSRLAAQFSAFLVINMGQSGGFIVSGATRYSGTCARLS
jgi:ComEC/Rec2-related protein